MNKKSATCHSAQQYDPASESYHEKLKLSDDNSDYEINYEKVALLRKQLASGQLRIDPVRLAEKMLEAEKNLFPEDY